MGVIYQIVIAGGSRTYIGSAHRLPYRKASHLSMLRKGTHHCRALQNAFDKYGFEAITWVVLEMVDDRSMLIEREQTWLDHFAGKLYNKSPTAASRLGATMSDEARAKISASLKGNQYRKGKPFSVDERAMIGAAVKAAYANGSKKPTPNPENLRAYNEAYRRGEKIHPRKNPIRDTAIAAMHLETGSLKRTGEAFNIGASAVWYAVKRVNPSQLRSKRCQDT